MQLITKRPITERDALPLLEQNQYYVIIYLKDNTPFSLKEDYLYISQSVDNSFYNRLAWLYTASDYCSIGLGVFELTDEEIEKAVKLTHFSPNPSIEARAKKLFYESPLSLNDCIKICTKTDNERLITGIIKIGKVENIDSILHFIDEYKGLRDV